MNIKEIEAKQKCEKCGHVFKGKEVLLKPPPKGIRMGPKLFGLSFVFVDKTGKIIGGNLGPTETDQVLHCPKCEAPHIFGFDSP